MHKVVLWIQIVLVPIARAGGHLRRRVPRLVVPQRPRDQRHPGRDLVAAPIPSAPGSTCSWPRWARWPAASSCGRWAGGAGRPSSCADSARRASSGRGPPSRSGTCWPSPSRRCCRRPCRSRSSSSPPASSAFRGAGWSLTLVIARGMRYTFWAVLGAVYGDEALELAEALRPAGSPDRWPLRRADRGRRRPGPGPRPGRAQGPRRRARAAGQA